MTTQQTTLNRLKQRAERLGERLVEARFASAAGIMPIVHMMRRAQLRIELHCRKASRRLTF